MALFRLWLTWDLSSRMESSLRSRARIRSVSFGCVPWAKDIAKRKFKRLSPARTCTNQKAALPKADIEELKDLFGDEFVDFNLVFCSSNGKPIEGQVINRAFNKLIEEKGLPKVVFHSLRHSSITYKLKLNGGDMKSVQGDSGHAQVKMVADVYSHIIDDDRRLNAERMEAAFYSGRQATPEPVQPAATESSADDKELLLKLLQNPEMAALLKSLAKTL